MRSITPLGRYFCNRWRKPMVAKKNAASQFIGDIPLKREQCRHKIPLFVPLAFSNGYKNVMCLMAFLNRAFIIFTFLR
jgi:hypothetical protein